MINSVLSIEDDYTLQFLNEMILKENDCCKQIVKAFNGKEAMIFFEKFHTGEEPIKNLPEIILLDLNMPIMNGWEFYEAFENKFPLLIERTKIFILSTSLNPSDVERANKEKHIVAFLEKPLDGHQLEKIKKFVKDLEPIYI